MFGATRTLYIALVALALGIALYGSRGGFTQYREATTIGMGVSSFQELEARFKNLADAKGGEYAFEILKRAPVPPGTDVHLLGHVVGDELYKQKGISGIAVCTQDFRNACSHAIVIGALNEFGAVPSTIEKIRTACAQAPGGSGAYTMCFHGLGHGVFAYFGYDIPKAVAFCKRLGTEAYHDQEYAQCVGGMTMELIDGGGHDHDSWVVANKQYLDPRDPLSPCDRAIIPYEVKNFCYIYLTPNLFVAAGADLAAPAPVTFPKAFGFCSVIADRELRKTCYGSFGKEFVPLAGARDIRRVDEFSDAEYAQAISWCMLGPDTEARTACIGQGLASVFWGGENNPQAAFRFCSLVQSHDEQWSCYDELGLNIASYTTGDTRTNLCNSLPEEYREKCLHAQVSPEDAP